MSEFDLDIEFLMPVAALENEGLNQTIRSLKQTR
jgi:hypothetical protein